MKIYTPDDFDNQGALKVPAGVYLLLLFILRGYIVWVVSLTQFGEQKKVIDWVYPDKNMFFLSLISGFVALIVFSLLSLRRKSSPSFLFSIWKKSKLMLSLSLIIDLGILGYQVIQSNYAYQLDVSVALVLNLWCWLYLLRSRQLRDCFNDWPVKE